MHPKKVVLHMLIDVESVDAVLAETRLIMGLSFPGKLTPHFDLCFADTVRLFLGRYDGYQSCKTEYHDLRHTLEVLLATVRMIHATTLAGRQISLHGAELALMAALMHDIGYIPEESDHGGGGQYTLVHVERSATFFENYGLEIGLAGEDVEACCCMITATSLSIDPDSIRYRDPETELLAKLVASSDLLGQLADRLYLEKLLFLYREFLEAGVLVYPHEFDLLNQTRTFYATVRRRLDESLGRLDQPLSLHFRERWQMDWDLYSDAIALNLQYLDIIIEKHKDDYREKLKRGGIVDRIIRSEGVAAAPSGE
jgi:hypothetical protein